MAQGYQLSLRLLKTFFDNEILKYTRLAFIKLHHVCFYYSVDQLNSPSDLGSRNLDPVLNTDDLGIPGVCVHVHVAPYLRLVLV